MKTKRICPSCQKPLPPEAVQELCPECLMKAGLASTANPGAGQPGDTPRFVPPTVLDLARLFPHLEILELVGQGGMGAVYKARQPALERLVALKILPPEATADLGFAERFAREARALAQLGHPNIVSVYDFGQAGGLHYFVMEYVDGLNLRQLERAGRLTPRQALEIVPQICDALQFAHDEGIVHRDIKPENVMVDKRGRVKITDFGLAKLLGREPENPRLTGEQDVMGTPHYMAPEQIEKPQSVDHRADIYSLGVVFYELLTGELPLGKFAPPSKKVAVDVRLDEVVLHTLEKEPERRYQHANEVKTDVETIAQTTATPTLSGTTTAEAAQAAAALRQVNGPAIGLIVTAILNWVGIPLVVLVLTVATVAPEGRGVKAFVLTLPLAAMVLSGLMLVAGLKMKRLETYWLAVAGSILAILITPGNIVGLPVGIWSLVVLSQKQVRAMFGQEHPLPLSPPPPATAAANGAWKVAAVIVAAILLLAAVPIGAIVLGVTLPALHRAKAMRHTIVTPTAEAQRFGPVTEVTLNDLDGVQGGQALDLDAVRLLDVPEDVRNRSHPEGQKWLENAGADLLLDRVDGRWGLMTLSGNELKLRPASEEEWVNGPANPPPAASLQVFSETIRRRGWVVHVIATNVAPPLTFSCQTGTGASGLLRIVCFNEDPNSAKLQFKQVLAHARTTGVTSQHSTFARKMLNVEM